MIVSFQYQVGRRSAKYAEQTAPPCVTVAKSTIPNAGLGVLASEAIPKQTRFGPYEGEITRNGDKAQKSGYSWKVSTFFSFFCNKVFVKMIWMFCLSNVECLKTGLCLVDIKSLKFVETNWNNWSKNKQDVCWQ